MVNVALALLATLAALGGAGLLLSRTLPDRRMYLLAWCGTLLALGIALGSMTIGFASGFRPALLRSMELFGSLIAPLTLALGVVELIARTVQARFAARLIAASYVIVAVVIILLDPIIGTFGKSLPKVTGHYSSLPGLVLDGAHIFAVVSLVSCVAVTAVRGNKRDRKAAEAMMTLAMVALAGVLIVAAMRSLLPGPLAPLALGGAAALIWFGASRLPGAINDHDQDQEPEPYEDMSRFRKQPYDDGQYDNTGPRRRPPQQHPQNNGGYERQRYEQQPSFAPPAAMPMPQPGPPLAQSMGQYGRIMIYTLIDGHGDAFDRLAAEVAHNVRQTEPGTLVYACHTVDNAPNQRLFYQLFRDANSVEMHTRQPHVQRFAQEARAHVSGTNVIELTVSAGNIAQQAPPRPEGPPQGQPVRWQHG
ncbi:antibiotic biosynthesis monooxygenase [Actinomadura sp. DC4]|uniref:putative quinol monooxygenase n=1 Tax=Actinomadura sp. DC4 TaxID=3055069 RepID=UPI0025B06958|nr:antibiotic biosynthesis monooxygenase [Actinomadura sp. DC4]MDN3353969.1 antibiotic biosynthesis monooxygenase [Actinomadura sp. DC4]